MLSKLFLALISLLLLGVARASDDNEPVTVVLFMFFGLGVGVLVTQLLSVFGEAIPYTVLVLLLGLLFSLASDSTDTFGESISQWTDINAELLLFVFLPPLIFGEAMSLNWHHLKGGFFQAVLLAGPGVLIGAGLMGSLTKLIIPHWGWNLAMTFGSILAATDPVAVVALLKSVGASPKLTILIVGESLLNDGTAMVLFEVFFHALNGEKYTAAEIITYALAGALGSVCFGIGCGVVCVRWLRSANRPLKETDVTMQIAMTITCAYLTFFTAQYLLRMSGVLACCGAGAMLAYLGPPIILNHESMHNVWGMAEWALNTMIFLLAGAIIGNQVLKDVAAIDWLIMLLFYAMLMVVRAITIVLLFPLLSKIGHGCSPLEAVFMSWAGLRGALGMALALIVKNDGPEDISDELNKLFFYVGGIAALTLVVNAITAKGLLFSLGLLTTNSAEKMLVTNQIKRKLKRKMDKVVSEMTKEFSFTDKDLEEVRLSCTLLQDVNMDYLYRDTERMSAMIADSIRQKYVSEVTSDLPETARPTSSFSSQSGGKKVTVQESHAMRDERADSKASNPSKQSFSRVLSSVGITANPQASETADARLRRMSHLLSLGSRPRSAAALLDYDLLMYIRSIFLEIVRVKYWHFIEIGKLPRLSFSAQYLFYSIEVGLDNVYAKNSKEVDKDIYSKDWVCIDSEIHRRLPVIDFLTFLEGKLPQCCTDRFITSTLSFLETRREKRLVYVLTSFIEAHEHAQARIHKFLGVEEDPKAAAASDQLDEEGDTKDDDLHEVVMSEDGSPKKVRKSVSPLSPEQKKREKAVEELLNQTPEEILVIEESKLAVERAKRVLSEMDPEAVAGIRAKQAARMVLAKEAEMVKNLVSEGLLTAKHAEEFLEEISRDTHRIEKERNRLYREQAKRRSRLRKAHHNNDDIESNSGTFNRLHNPASGRHSLKSPLMDN